MSGAAGEIAAELRVLAMRSELSEETRFAERADAVDFLEFNILERIAGLMQGSAIPAHLLPLLQEAGALKARLENIDAGLFLRLRAELRAAADAGKAFRAMLDRYAGGTARDTLAEGDPGYDHLDAFINGLVHSRPIPAETLTRESGMVYFQKTPARTVLRMVATAGFATGDVFYDLGSGLGQVAILVNLLCGITAKGIEFEPAYCGYASACASDLGLSRVEFQQGDARDAGYSDGNAFFLYTPFEGEMLEAVLRKLRGEAERGIKVLTYGPCTAQVTRQTWLRRLDTNGGNIHALGSFASR